VSGCNVNETFPEGAFGYDLQVTSQSDQYRVWMNTGSTGFNGNRQTMDQLIATLTSAPSCIGWCSVDIQIKSYDVGSKTGRIKWRKHNTESFTEETGFSVIDVNGVKVLKYENSNLFRDLENEDRVWGIFAEMKNSDGTTQIERGEFNPKNMRQSIPFNGETKIGNAKVLDTYIKMRNMSAYPY
jgi:predicted porin